MTDRDDIRQRTREAAHLQTIEGNPLDADDIAMFEMFDREGFSVEQQLDYVRRDLRRRAGLDGKEQASAASSR